MRHFAALLLLASGCITHVQQQCPSCVVVDGAHTRLPPLKPGTQRLFVLVPGLLGYGWEWDSPVERLRKTPGVDFVVFWWEPWGSVDRAARELDAFLWRALVSAPPSVREVVVVAHSAGGLVAAHAVGRLPPPPRKLTLVTIGAPFAGMHICPWSEVDILHAPLMLSVAAVYHRYPPPPAGVNVIEYITSYPADPVMQPHWGTQPAEADVGPVGATRIDVDPRLDHNYVVDKVMSDLLGSSRADIASKANGR
jgi:pimeloyl-ACP methyl ester carboxylesterase